MTRDTARLLITCPDAKGIIALVAGFIAEHGGNILEADQHTDPQHGEFYMRVEIDLNGFALDQGNFQQAWGEWIKYRRKRRLTTSEDTLTSQLAALGELGTVEAAVAEIKKSIGHGWQSVCYQKDQANDQAESGSRVRSGEVDTVDRHFRRDGAGSGT